MKTSKSKSRTLVDNAKTAFYIFKIQASNSRTEVFHNFNAKRSPHLSHLLWTVMTPQAFSEYFTNKVITKNTQLSSS